MEPSIAISTINDFLYCPRSLYMHLAAGEISPASYHDVPQTRGNAIHSTIDKKEYSNRKNILQNLNIYSEKLGIHGKLDTFDTETGELIERKAHLSKIFEGHLMQLYAQYYCLLEMDYKPKKLAFYSALDNKKRPTPLPTLQDKKRLIEIIKEMQSYAPEKLLKHNCKNCDNNIYSALGW